MSTPVIGQSSGAQMPAEETLMGAAATLVIAGLGAGLHLWRRVSVLETHRGHDEETLAKIEKRVEGMDEKLDTLLTRVSKR